jgi:hypothetical protein
MNWYIGQEIVCVKTHSERLVKKDELHTILGLKQCKCGAIKIDVDIEACCYIDFSCCGIEYENHENIMWFSETLFRPLDELADITELTEVLENTKPFEV